MLSPDWVRCLRPFAPAPWLPGAHAQTIWPFLFRKPPAVRFTVESVVTPDQDRIWLHHMVVDRAKPTVLLLPGLESTSRSHYVLGTCDQIRNAGWNATVMEYRGCSREMNLAKRLYHSGATDDIDLVIRHLQASVPSQPLTIIGFSLGGNLAGKWLGEVGAHAGVAAAALISTPYDLAASARKIDAALYGLYSRHFVRSLIAKAVEKNCQFPGLLPIERIRRCRTIVGFDDIATAPLHGFRDAWDYYARSSCGQFLSAIRVPTLLLSATDDPYIPAGCFPHDAAAESKYLVPLLTRKGGHQGFVAGGLFEPPRYWAEEIVVNFLQHALA